MPAEYAPGSIVPITSGMEFITAEDPQIRLRFVLRDGKRILQQLWAVTYYKYDRERQLPVPDRVTSDWRDVPLEVE